METNIDEPERELGLGDYVAILKRRWRSGVYAFVSVIVVAAAVALLLPPVYRSTATILIEQQAIPPDLVRSTITSFADQRIQLIRQRVMTTANLLDIVRRHGLYPKIFQRRPREVVIERMREDIHTDMISADVVDPRSGRPTQATIAFTVGYDNRSPELATRVANELTSLYLQENSQTRRQQAAEASSFLASEAKRLSDEIAGLEGKLADFKEKNVDRLPELNQLNLQLLNRTQTDLDDVRRRRSSLEERRIYLESQLSILSPSQTIVGSDGNAVLGPHDRLKALESYLASIRGIYTPNHPDIVRTEKSIKMLRAQLGEPVDDENVVKDEKELDALKVERAALLDRYDPAHPDVVRLDRRIEAAEANLAAVRDAARTEAPDGTVDPSDAPDNPAYVQLQAQLETVKSDQRALDSEESDLRRRLKDLEGRLREGPATERDYDALTRDLQTARRQYQEVNGSQMEAVVAQNLEMDDKGERFQLIDPPLLPQQPIAPNRPVIMLLGVLLALAAAFGTLAVRESMDRSVRGVADLGHLLRTAPLGVIPVIVTTDDKRTLRRRRLGYAVATVGVFCLAVVLISLFVAPIDVLWFAALRRFGV
jgi:protein tyrosine kinase modulator